MAHYKLTLAADEDFEQIFEYGIDNFGLAQALKYQTGLKEQFSFIAEQPKLYQKADNIREGYRRSIYQAHIIYFKEGQGDILIVRVLGQQNPKTAL